MPSRSVRARPVTRMQKTDDLECCLFWCTPRMKRASRFPPTPAKNMKMLVAGLPSERVLLHDEFEMFMFSSQEDSSDL